MIYALWFGGSGYAPGDMVQDLESFPSLAAAKAALVNRERYGCSFRQGFQFVNREAEQYLCPCVEGGSSMWVWRGADEVDGITYVPDYPDNVVEFGPRGGVRVVAA